MKRFFQPVILFLAVVALYARTAGFEFIRLDDPEYTFFNPFVWNGLSWQNVVTAFRDFTHGGIWMPVTYISYMFDITIFGRSPFGHHLVNVLLHATNTILLWRLLVVLFRRTAGTVETLGTAPFWAALIWAVHPVCVEPVSWIAGRKELLWTGFALLGIISFVQRTRRSLILSYIFCAFACLSKPTAVCFPLLTVLLDDAIVLPSGSADAVKTVGADHRAARRPISQLLLRHIPFWFMSLATGAVALYSQSHAAGYDPVSLFANPWYKRLLTAAGSLGLYLVHTFVPCGLHLDYTANGTEIGIGLAVMFLVLGVAAWACWRNHFDRRILCALAAVLPTLGIFGQFGEQTYADRFWYAPLAVCATVFVLLVVRLLRVIAIRRPCRVPDGDKVCHAHGIDTRLVLFPLVLFLACVTWRLGATWRNDLTLFSRVLACEPANGRALCHVASERCARFNDLDGGILLFRRSLAVRPRFDTRAQLAYALSRRGKPGDAREIYTLGTEVVRDVRRDRKGMMLEALGRAAAELGRDDDAIRFLTASIRAPARFYPADDAKALLKEINAAK